MQETLKETQRAKEIPTTPVAKLKCKPLMKSKPEQLHDRLLLVKLHFISRQLLFRRRNDILARN